MKREFKEFNKIIIKQPHGKLFKQLLAELRGHVSSGDPIKNIAHRAGVSPSTVRKWLNWGTYSPHLRTICAVASALGLRLVITQA